MEQINIIKLYLFIQIFYTCFDSVFTLSCLVIRPGKGLMSEKCPQHAVGCRIRIEGDIIQWYEYSKLYDRNQLVCVHQNEYNLKEMKKSGCIKKKSGSVRCWCYGQSNCNNPDVSTMLYQGFLQLDDYEFDKIVEQVDTNDQPDYENFDEDNIDDNNSIKNGQYRTMKPLYTNSWSYQLKTNNKDPIHHIAHPIRGGKDARQDPETINNTEYALIQQNKFVNTLKVGKISNEDRHTKYVDVGEDKKNDDDKIISKAMRPISKNIGNINELGKIEIGKNNPDSTKNYHRGKGVKIEKQTRLYIQSTKEPKYSKEEREKHLDELERKILLSPNPEVTEDEFSELINTDGQVKIPSEISFHGESNYADMIDNVEDEPSKTRKNTNDNFLSQVKTNNVSDKKMPSFILVVFFLLKLIIL
uniref:Rhoptry neck protein 6 n=1 Tax=Strongyloides venezuelensis TaxID=75913 RepID=A0A0K0F5L3_STRVS